MDCFLAFLLMLLIVVVVTAQIGHRAGNRRRRRRLFKQLAAQFAGVHESGGIFGTPRVRLRYGETVATVSELQVEGTFSGPALQVSIAWPHFQIRCEMIAAPRSRMRRQLRYSWPRIPVDPELLGPEIVVTGFPEQEVQQLLSSGVRWQIDRLRRLHGDRRLHVLIGDGQIVVQTYWKRLRADQAAQFVQGALELYDQCMLARACGIEFLHQDEAQTLDNVTCKICGDPLYDNLVYCRRCKTPHHQECWRYAGVCSVFGCRETVYYVPQSAPTPGPMKKPR